MLISHMHTCVLCRCTSRPQSLHCHMNFELRNIIRKVYVNVAFANRCCHMTLFPIIAHQVSVQSALAVCVHQGGRAPLETKD